MGFFDGVTNYVSTMSASKPGNEPGVGEYVYASSIEPEMYVNAFSPDGTHTSTDTKFEDTQNANVKKSDPNYSIATGYALPAAAPSPVPKLLVLGVAGFAVYWFIIKKK